MTGADFPDFPFASVGPERLKKNFWHEIRNIMAKENVYYHGRRPVASDLPLIEPISVEVPNPNHPFGVKGVAEAGMVSSLGCVANESARGIGRRSCSRGWTSAARSFDRRPRDQQLCNCHDSSELERT